MPLLAGHSPYSVLGLKYGAYTQPELRKAFLNALLYCHPDKSSFLDFLPPNYYALVQAAYDSLKNNPTQNQFKGYPVLFFPLRENSSSPNLYRQAESTILVCECGEIFSSTGCGTSGCPSSLSQKFIICTGCKIPIAEQFAKRHLSEHKDLCHCGEIASQDHYKRSHPEAICPLCEKISFEMSDHVRTHAIQGCCDALEEETSDLVYHIQHEHHECPLCHRMCGTNYDDHLVEVHHFSFPEDLGSCEDCDELNAAHFKTSHPWILCPFPGCELDIALGHLWEHCRKHKLKRCATCPRTEVDFAADTEHAASHAMEICIECSHSYESRYLPFHQVEKHEWLLCSYCNRAESSDDILQEHIEIDHRLADCPVCSSRHLEGSLDSHLQKKHGWMACPWCRNAFEEEELRKHIIGSHPEKEKCFCGYEDTKKGLEIHLTTSHSWLRCPHCDQLEAPSLLERHIAGHQLITCQEQECAAQFREEQKNEHLKEHHSYRQCPFCATFDSQELLLQHMASHVRAQSQESKGSLSLTGKRARNLAKEKCQECRQKKVKCSFITGQDECEKCLKSDVPCSGPSRYVKRLKSYKKVASQRK